MEILLISFTSLLLVALGPWQHVCIGQDLAASMLEPSAKTSSLPLQYQLHLFSPRVCVVHFASIGKYNIDMIRNMSWSCETMVVGPHVVG